MKEITLRELSELCEKEVKNGGSITIVTEAGDYFGTLVIPQTDYIKLSVEFLGEQSNGVMPAKETS